MKKKNLYIVLSGIILVCGLVSIIFLFGGKDNNKLSQNKDKKINKIVENQTIDDKATEEIIIDESSKDEDLENIENENISIPEEINDNTDNNNEIGKENNVVIDITPSAQIQVEEVHQEPVVIVKEEPVIVKTKQIISDEKIKEEKVLEEKYGTKKMQLSYYNVIKYDDETSEKNFLYDEIYYDKSGYNASTSDVVSEARTVSNQNNGIYLEVLNYVNNYRNAVGAAPLTLDNEASVAATVRALEMAYSGGVYDISHTRPNGSSCFSVADELGVDYLYSIGENIAAGQRTASDVTNSWYNSPGHRDNMEDESFKKIGIGMYELDGIKYWVQIFIG